MAQSKTHDFASLSVQKWYYHLHIQMCRVDCKCMCMKSNTLNESVAMFYMIIGYSLEFLVFCKQDKNNPNTDSVNTTFKFRRTCLNHQETHLFNKLLKNERNLNGKMNK